MIKEAIEIISQKKDLSRQQMQLAMEEIMGGEVETAQIVSFLTELDKKGESVEELTAAVEVMRRHVTRIKTKQKVVLDTCGTGGDKAGTFNISTAAAFVASSCGISVAKHGNRSVSSLCGSADILEALGININLAREKVEQCLDEIGIAFLFAPNLHPAMKYAMPARKQIGKRTIFNILGPLTNPAGATHQLVGVFALHWTEVLAQVLVNLGTVHAVLVHGKDGLDEITTTTNTYISEAKDGKIKSYEINPEDFGFKKAKLADLAGGSVVENTKIILEVLKGKPGPQRDIVVFNAAAAIYAADKAKSIQEGIAIASQTLDSGRALEKLEALKQFSQQ